MKYPKPVKLPRKHYRKHGIPDYDRKYAHIYRRQSGFCPISKERLGMNSHMHHVWANDETNNRLYPHYVHSVWNLCLLRGGAHLNEGLPKKPPESEVKQAEDILAHNPDLQYDASMEEALRSLEVAR